MSTYHKSRTSIALVFLFLGFMYVASATTLYVDQNVAGGSNDGSSWANAFTDLQFALTEAESNLAVDQIWVAAGTYKPIDAYGIGDGSTRYNHYRLINGVAIYGGFAGTETMLSQRNIQSNPTILSGDIGTEGVSTDNCYHVFYHPSGTDLDVTAVLNGFTITGGNADDAIWPHDSGGGMFNYSGSSPTVSNCTFSNNAASNWGGGIINDELCDPTITDCTFSGNTAPYGGGMHNYNSLPEVTNCTFSTNAATTSGGGMYNDLSSLVLTNCEFTGNDSEYGGGIYSFSSDLSATNCIFKSNTADFGGGIYFEESTSPTVTSCLFSGNATSIGGYGGGIANEYGSDASIINCTFSGNAAGYGGGVENYDSAPVITNTILYGNTSDFNGNEIFNDTSTPTISYCDISGSGGSSSWDTGLGTDGGGNIDSDPLFVDADGADNTPGTADDDLQLQSTSPCIDAANGDVAPTTDILGNDRYDHPMDDIGTGAPTYVDMGAYEYQVTAMTDLLCSENPDFDGNGTKDLLWEKDSNSANYITLMASGNGVRGPLQYIPNSMGGVLEIVGFGDFDGNGTTDLLWEKDSTSAKYITLMTSGTGACGPLQYIPNSTGGVLEIVDLGDFDGNGTTDLLWEKGSTSANYITLMTSGTGARGPFQFISNSTGGTLEIVDLGDFDGNGTSDLLWENTSTSANFIRRMALNTGVPGPFQYIPDSSGGTLEIIAP